MATTPIGYLDVAQGPIAVTQDDPLPVYLAEQWPQSLKPSNSILNAPSNSTSIAYEAGHQIKVGAGILFGLAGHNSKASAQFILIHDSATLPAEGAIPKIIITVPASSNFSVDFGAYGRGFSNGIYVVNSSTGPTKTIGSADCWFDAQFE